MTTSTPTRIRPDVIIAGVMLVVFALALVFTIGWPDQAALLPRIVSALGLIAAMYFLSRILVSALRARSEHGVADVVAATPVLPPARVRAEEDVPDEGEVEDPEEDDVEYVFATVGRRAWARALAWIAGFFVLMALFGIFIAAGVFALSYLRFSGQKSWLFSAVYAAILTGALYALMRVVTFIPSPPGLILPGW